jgi:hypothetical protein
VVHGGDVLGVELMPVFWLNWVRANISKRFRFILRHGAQVGRVPLVESSRLTAGRLKTTMGHCQQSVTKDLWSRVN